MPFPLINPLPLSDFIDFSSRSPPQSQGAPFLIVEHQINTAVGKSKRKRPSEFDLFQNYPNPFNPETQIRYAIPKQVYVRMDIYNVAGKKVVTLVNGVMNAGYHSVIWDGRDSFGHAVSGGLYLCRIQAGGYNRVIRMLYLK